MRKHAVPLVLVPLGTAAVLILSDHDPWFGVNAGFVAVCVNGTVCVGVGLLTSRVATVPRPYSST